MRDYPDVVWFKTQEILAIERLPQERDEARLENMLLRAILEKHGLEVVE